MLLHFVVRRSGRVYYVSSVASGNGRSWPGSTGEREIFSLCLPSTQIELKATECLCSSSVSSFSSVWAPLPLHGNTHFHFLRFWQKKILIRCRFLVIKLYHIALNEPISFFYCIVIHVSLLKHIVTPLLFNIPSYKVFLSQQKHEGFSRLF